MGKSATGENCLTNSAIPRLVSNISNMQYRKRPYDYSKLRPNYPRSKTGCLSCRLRKKKCDEAKPRCQACCRNRLDCEWPGQLSSDSIPGSASQQTSATQDETLASAPVSIASHSQSPTRDLPRPGTACTLTPASVALLRHYLEYTAGLLCTSPPGKSPFITVVLPLAYADDLLMHTVLALSGTHLECRQSRWQATSTRGIDPETQNATALHYQKTISGLREELADFDSADGQKQVRLLLVLIMACHYEAVSGNKSNMILQHLRASREIVERLSTQSQGSNIYQESLGFSLELYAYLSIINSLASYRSIGKLGQPYDPFLTSLDRLSSYSTFGSMFGGCHLLYELIPHISQLGVECLAEEKFFRDQWIPSARLQLRYEALELRIATRILPPSTDPFAHYELADIRTAAEAIRHGLYIYLMTSFCASKRPNAIVQSEIKSHADIVLDLVTSVNNMRTRTILLWPCIIAGSCMADGEQQQRLVYALLHSGFDMAHLLHLCDMLEQMWSDDDASAYGPYGLYLIMEKKSKYVPIL